MSPKDICCMSFKEETGEYICNTSIVNGKLKEYKLIKSVEECVDNYTNCGDIYYKLPSKYIRSLLNIKNCEGNKYFDEYNDIVSIYYKAGDPFKYCTNLLVVDRNRLFSSLEKENKNFFWSIRLLKQATATTYEKYDSLNDDFDRSWIVWYDVEKIRSEILLV